MINYNEAKVIAKNHISSLTNDSNIVIVENATIERSYGWIFFYNDLRFIETEDYNFALAGNAPFLVDKEGDIEVLGTADPVEEYLVVLDEKHKKRSS